MTEPTKFTQFTDLLLLQEVDLLSFLAGLQIPTGGTKLLVTLC